MNEARKSMKLSDLRRILTNQLKELKSNSSGDKRRIKMLKECLALHELSVKKVGDISKDRVVQSCLDRIDELKHKSEIIDEMILHIERLRYNTITSFLNAKKNRKGFSGYDFIESVEHSCISFLEVYRVVFETICNVFIDLMDLMTDYEMSYTVEEWFDKLKESLETSKEPLKTKIEMALLFPLTEEEKCLHLLSFKTKLEGQELVSKTVLEWIEERIKDNSIRMSYFDHSDFARPYDSPESVLGYFDIKLKALKVWSKAMKKNIANYQHAIDLINSL